jgi:hypothetical protein
MTRLRNSAIRRKLTGGFLLLSSLLIVDGIALPAMGAAADDGSIVRTEGGPARGFI